MAYPKQHHLDKRVPESFCLRRRTKIAFDMKCKELGRSKSSIVEELITEFLMDLISEKK